MLQHDWPIDEAMFWSFHPLADKANIEHLPKQGHTKIALVSIYQILLENPVGK